jgi:uncharacterized protein YkwD
MRRFCRTLLRGISVMLAVPAALPPAAADALSTVQMLRAGGCGGILPAAPPVRRNVVLDRVAEQWADGRALAAAAEDNGYRPELTGGLHFSGTDDSMVQQLRHSGCRILVDREVRGIGVYRRASDTWLVVVSPFLPSALPSPDRTPFPPAAGSAVPPQQPGAALSTGPAISQQPRAALPTGPAVSQQPRAALPTGATVPLLSTQALQLVNEVRAHGTRCGTRVFAPAPPLRLSGTLAGVALGHADDMAEHNYFEHENLAGKSPADRVRAAGYSEKLVGENLAYGPGTVEEVVQGWLDSPGHCENIMDPRFVEMGIAYAPGRASRHGLYWVQLFAEPRA